MHWATDCHPAAPKHDLSGWICHYANTLALKLKVWKWLLYWTRGRQTVIDLPIHYYFQRNICVLYTSLKTGERVFFISGDISLFPSRLVLAIANNLQLIDHSWQHGKNELHNIQYKKSNWFKDNHAVYRHDNQ